MSNLLTIEALISIVGSIALIASVSAQMQNSMKLFRPIMILACGLWIGYNVLNETYIQGLSYAGILAIHLARYNKLEREKNNQSYSEPFSVFRPRTWFGQSENEMDVYEEIARVKGQMAQEKAELDYLDMLRKELDEKMQLASQLDEKQKLQAKIAELSQKIDAAMAAPKEEPKSNIFEFKPKIRRFGNSDNSAA